MIAKAMSLLNAEKKKAKATLAEIESLKKVFNLHSKGINRNHVTQ